MYNSIESFWQNDYYFPSYDVVIVGGGFTGLTAGIELLLRKPKLKVGIIESQTHGTLASSRNAGFMCFGSPTELLTDIQAHGPSAISSLLKLKADGYTTLLKHLAGNKGIYSQTFGYELFDQSTSASALDNVHNNLPMLNELLQEATSMANYFSKKSDFNANPSFFAVQFKKEGQIHPTAAVSVLARKFMNLGGIFHTGTAVTSWSLANQGFLLQTTLQKEIQSRRLIVANNAFATQLLPEHEVQPQRAQVLVTAPLKKLIYRGNFHMDKGYVYFRNIGNRLLLGGLRNSDFASEATSDLGLNNLIQGNLDKLLQRLLQEKETPITHRWSGIMGFRSGKIPSVDKHHTGIIMVAGMNGMGTLLGPALGKQAALVALQS